MILISHRGNTCGRLESHENEPAYIDLAIRKGFDVEVDVWLEGVNLWLGHDRPQYGITLDWIAERSERLWVHCKNIEALAHLKSNAPETNYFWHQEDDVTITSKGHLWTYPGKKLTMYSIACMPETHEFENIELAMGICSDKIENYI